MDTNVRKILIRMSKLCIYGIVMHLSIFTLVFATDSNAQTKSVEEIHVNMDLKGSITLGNVIRSIESVSDFEFSHIKQEINTSSYTLQLESRDYILGDLLREISTQTSLSFKRVNDNIFIRKKENNVESVIEVLRASADVTGTIIDENGEPLPGATIVEKGTSNGTITDVEGKFSLAVNEGSVLLISFVGYIPQEIAVGSQSNITVSLAPDFKSLEEVVVVGYGTVKKSDLTGAVGTVDQDVIESQPVARLDQALQGKVSGVQVTSVSGAPGEGASIRIRGGNSINAGNEPLYVIDGFIGGGDLNSLNPADIKSIEVLKDASATAIYGSRGSNGVVLITTKRGTGAGFGVSYDGYYGVQSVVNKIDMLNGPEFAEYRNEFDEFNGQATSFPDMSLISNTDWQDVLFRSASIQNHNVSISNSANGSNYFASLNYFDQDGIQIGSGFKRYQIRVNYDKELGKLFKTGASINTSYTNREIPRAVALVNNLLPTAPIYNEDGSFFSTDLVQGSTYNNPVAQNKLIDDNTKTARVLGNTYVQFQPIEGLIVKSTFGFDILNSKNTRYESGTLPTRTEQETGGFAKIATSTSLTVQNENTITYSKEFGDHSLNVLGGWTYQQFNQEDFGAQSQGFSNDIIKYNAIETGDPLLTTAYSDESSWTLYSGLYRLNYGYKGKYLVTLSGRHDGSSRLSKDNKWEFFPSAAVAWRVSSESFMQNVSTISDLKLRASYGKVGSQSIDPYATLAQLGTGVSYIGGQTVNTYFPLLSANPNLKWEVTDQVDVGVDVGFFEDRFQLTLDYYYKRTNDLLLARELSFQTGFDTRLENVGSLENKGIELNLGGAIINTSNFKWDANFNIAANKNKVLALSGGREFIERSLGNVNLYTERIIVGEPIGTFYGAKFLGLWQEGDEGLEESGAVPGSMKFEDLDDNGIIDVNDGQIIGNANPDFYGGLTNTLDYKNFTLSLFIDFSVGNDVYDLDGRNFNTGHATNVYGKFRNRWTPENTDTSVPRAGSQVGRFFSGYEGRNSDYLIQDGSFVRLQNVNLQYRVPIQKEFIEQLSVYISARNLLTITGYDGFSPDVNNRAGSPTLKGFDDNDFPLAKVYTVGIKARF